MNKNWLYRVLALVLIAMLALPVALAEEVEEVEAVLGADGAVEDLYLGNNGAEENFYVPDFEEPEEYIEFGFDTKKIEPDAIDGDEYDAVGLLFDGDTGSYDDLVNITFKSNKTSVADVVYKYHAGNYAYAAVALYKPGKATITIKAKFGKMSGKHYKTKSKTVKVYLKIKSAALPDSVKTFFGDYYDGDDLEKSGHNYGKQDMGVASKVLMPVPFDADGNNISYSLEDADPAYTGGWKWKWSNAKVAFFAETGGAVYKEKQQSGYWMEDYEIDGDYFLVPVFFKPGSSTVTFTSANGKKATAKFTVKSKEKTWAVSKKNDKVSGSMIMKVKKVKFTDLEHAEVTIVCINDAGAKYPKGTYNFEIAIKTGADEYTTVFSGAKRIKDDVKDGAMKTFTLKFSGDEIETGWALPDLDKGKFECNSDDWTPSEPGPAWGNDAK